MAEPLHGILAEFPTPQALLEAAHKTHAAGYRRTDAFSPFPVEGVHDALGYKPSRLPMFVLIGGLTGGTLGFAMQCFASMVHYPLMIGGKPNFSWPAFIPVTFEMTILFAAASAVITMIVMNGLPKPYHPVFNVPRFEIASSHGFFLLIEASDPAFDPARVRTFLGGMGSTGVFDVPE